MIPKIIHYCWFGGNPKPEIIEKCIASWKKYCPDWEIVEWNESNYDVSSYPYVQEAYEAKKWAFVSDVVRLDVVFRLGGIYLDTDVELFQSIDFLRECDAFFVFETNRNINTGIGFGSEANHPAVDSMLSYYKDRHFCVGGKLDMTPCPAKNTEAIVAAYSEFRRNGVHQCFNNILVLSGDDYCKIAKHYSTGLWGEGMKAEKKKRKFRDTKFKRFIRKPEIIDWIEKKIGKKAADIYVFLAYDLMELGPLYFIKRLMKKIFGKRK